MKKIFKIRYPAPKNILEKFPEAKVVREYKAKVNRSWGPGRTWSNCGDDESNWRLRGFEDCPVDPACWNEQRLIGVEPCNYFGWSDGSGVATESVVIINMGGAYTAREALKVIKALECFPSPDNAPMCGLLETHRNEQFVLIDPATVWKKLQWKRGTDWEREVSPDSPRLLPAIDYDSKGRFFRMFSVEDVLESRICVIGARIQLPLSTLAGIRPTGNWKPSEDGARNAEKVRILEDLVRKEEERRKRDRDQEHLRRRPRLDSWWDPDI